MGCFDSVCAISHIPISDGDETVKIYLASIFDAEYRGPAWHPISLPIFGKYNDYGDLKDFDKDGVSWQFIQNLVRTEFRDVTLPTARKRDPFEVFDDRCGTDQIVPDGWTWGNKSEFKLDEPSKYKEDPQDEYTQVKGNGSRVDRLLIHRAVFDYIVDDFYDNSRVDYSPEKQTFRQHLDDIPDFINEVCKKIQVEKEVEAFNYDKELLTTYLEDKDFTLISLYTGVVLNPSKYGETSRHLLANIFDRGVWDHRPMQLHASFVMKDFFLELCEKGELDEAAKLLHWLCDLQAFVDGVTNFNMVLVPYIGHAAEQHNSETDSNRMIKLFNKFKSIEKRNIKKWLEEE